MAESKYISIPTSEPTTTFNNSAKGKSVDGTDVITLNILTVYNNDNNSTSMPQPHSTTPNSSTTRRLFSRKPKNLHLKIFSPSVETDNYNLSSDKFKTATATTNNSTSSTSPSTSATTNTSISIFPHEQNRASKKLNIGFENIRYTARLGFFRRGEYEVYLKVLSFYFIYYLILKMYIKIFSKKM